MLHGLCGFAERRGIEDQRRETGIGGDIGKVVERSHGMQRNEAEIGKGDGGLDVEYFDAVLGEQPDAGPARESECIERGGVAGDGGAEVAGGDRRTTVNEFDDVAIKIV